VEVVSILGDQVGRDAHDDEGRDPVQPMVGKGKRAMEAVRTRVRGSGTVIGGRRGGVVSNHRVGD
jgi:hypothetical protein